MLKFSRAIMPFCTMDRSGFNIPYSSGSPRTIIQEFRSRYRPREQFDERHEWWIQQYIDTDGKLLKKGLTFPYSATDLLAIFHALADGHKIKEDMKNHFLTVVKTVDRYTTVIVPLTEQEKLQVPRGLLGPEINFKWDPTKVFPDVITDLGLPFVAIRHLNPNDQVIVCQRNV
ncbi:hypothetical protein I302_105507 [Kwoniella bestiolae CBS 10118]|uniref:Uncharacterized protein n=1 Tax=Kwoniella bestiolae CBS 10118 TaxID=1296100 RepID=A0A1B9FTA5_9TREE|nr:hypothetical protein I302_08788 [Kwoniella bestiolae CBS 10118]OCF22007.1 hypothetical protein I302_08788 [Kwoniella bestiolae CBS 10118]